MIKLYYRSRCSSSTKAIDWFKKYKIDVRIKSCNSITREELIVVLSSTENGTSDIIKQFTRVKDDDKYKINSIQNMSLNEAIDFIKQNTGLLKTPIIIGDKGVLIGYNENRIRIFLSKKYRRSCIRRKF